MSVLVVGGEDYANLAGDTGMVAFGPLHSAHGRGRDASREMRAFRSALYDKLNVDPRRLTDESLRDLYHMAELRDTWNMDEVFPDVEKAREAVETTR